MNSPLLPRRDFLRHASAAALALPLTAAAAEKAAKAPVPASWAGASGNGRIGTLHVFSKPLQWLSYADTAALVAEAGYGGIDFPVRNGGQVLPQKVDDDLPRAVEAAQRAGLKVEMITTGVTSARDPMTEKVLRAAAKAGVKVYRFGNFDYDPKLGVWESLQRLRPVMKELADLNQSLGLHGAIQNHAGARVGAAVWDVYELVRDLDPRWIGLQYDIRHAIVEGAQSWPLPVRLLAPWIRCVDWKDFRWQQAPGKATIENTPIGEGIVPFDAYFKLVRELGIQGPASIHLEYPPFERDPRQLGAAEKRAEFLAAMKKDLAFLRAGLAKHKLA